MTIPGAGERAAVATGIVAAGVLGAVAASSRSPGAAALGAAGGVAAGGLAAYLYLMARINPVRLDPRSRRKLAELEGATADRAKRLVQLAGAQGVELAITDGFRSNAEQAKLYAQGRTEPGPIVTYAPPGQSWHNWGRAFDVAVVSGLNVTWPENPAFWAALGRLGESIGLRWGGRFPHPDRPHFEFHPGLSIADMGPTVEL